MGIQGSLISVGTKSYPVLSDPIKRANADHDRKESEHPVHHSLLRTVSGRQWAQGRWLGLQTFQIPIWSNTHGMLWKKIVWSTGFAARDHDTPPIGLVESRPKGPELLRWHKGNLDNTGHNDLCCNVMADQCIPNKTNKNVENCSVTFCLPSKLTLLFFLLLLPSLTLVWCNKVPKCTLW